MPSIPLKHKCLSIILIWVIVSYKYLVVSEKMKKKKKYIYFFYFSLFGKNGHGTIWKKGGYFQLGMRPKFGP